MLLILGSAHLFEPLHYCYSHIGVNECGIVFVCYVVQSEIESMPGLHCVTCLRMD